MSIDGLNSGLEYCWRNNYQQDRAKESIQNVKIEHKEIENLKINFEKIRQYLR